MKGVSRFLSLHTHYSSSFQTPLSKPSFLLKPTTYSSSSSSSSTPHLILTPEELTQVNLLLPRLCESNHLQQAIQLIDTCLLTNPPLNSLSLSLLLDRLTAEPDMTLPISLLTKLKHNLHARSSLLPINKMLLTCYFHKRKFKEPIKLLNWMSRPDSPCPPDAAVYEILVRGFCRHGKMLEALRVLRAMVGANVAPARDLNVQVYRGLLREARIWDAQELNYALRCVEEGDGGFHGVTEMLDRMIGEWSE
eukprot:TRINITY_DN2958_c2_g1_i1.p1 TRINITY_DN2958_c2_g1~~TRINITY_DN2958_c2_g1_i1.p1  ORF type:complete len:250 (-),score=18.28 TRINITY_DN2958_c2_g1_i1:118-867(-)